MGAKYIANSSIAIRVLLACAFLAIGFMFVKTIDAPEYRYRLYKDHYRYTYAIGGRIDALAIGSSRSQTAFQAAAFQDAVNCAGSQKLVIYDYSRSLPGLEMDYVMLRDVLERRSVSRIYLEYKKSNFYNRIHPYFYQVATFQDLWQATIGSSGVPLIERARLLLRLTMKKITNELALSIRRVPPGLVGKTPILIDNATRDHTPPQLVASNSILNYRITQGANWKSLKPEEWLLDSDTEAHTSIYIRRLKELADSKNTKLILHHIPIIYQPELAGNLDSQWHKDSGLRVLQLPMNLREQIYQEGFGDGGHMNARGAELYMRWLAERSQAAELCKL